MSQTKNYAELGSDSERSKDTGSGGSLKDFFVADSVEKLSKLQLTTPETLDPKGAGIGPGVPVKPGFTCMYDGQSHGIRRAHLSHDPMAS